MINSPDTIRGYQLLPLAENDLERIWRYSAETWSIEQADRYVDDLELRFSSLVELPMLGREVTDVDPAVRILVHEQYLLVYRVNNDMIEIIRILGGRQNWLEILRRIQ